MRGLGRALGQVLPGPTLGAYAFEAYAFGACCARCGRLRYNFPVLQRAASGLHMVCFVLELVLIRGKWHDCRVFIHPSR